MILSIAWLDLRFYIRSIGSHRICLFVCHCHQRVELTLGHRSSDNRITRHDDYPYVACQAAASLGHQWLPLTIPVSSLPLSLLLSHPRHPSHISRLSSHITRSQPTRQQGREPTGRWDKGRQRVGRVGKGKGHSQAVLFRSSSQITSFIGLLESFAFTTRLHYTQLYIRLDATRSLLLAVLCGHTTTRVAHAIDRSLDHRGRRMPGARTA